MQELPLTGQGTDLELKKKFHALYTALLFVSLHWAIVVYVNSSYLEQFVSHQALAMLYIIAAALTIFVHFFASRFLASFGAVRLITTLTILEFCTLIGMSLASTPNLAITLFVIHQTIVPLIFFGLDILMEELIGTREDLTGGKRGFFLFIISTTYALAILAVGSLLGEGHPNFELVYFIGALFLIPFLLVFIHKFKDFIDPHYRHFNMREGIKYLSHYKDIRNVLFSHFFLQLFFVWMVIYTPIYLATNIGFNWREISIILFVGLSAYIFLEYFIGVIADKYIGEKEMMAFGFAVIAVSTSWFIFLDNSSVIVWAIVMFMTRAGASFVEATTESYFFKHTAGKDINVIGLFRMTRPLSYVIGPVLGTAILYFLPFNILFLFIGLLMIPGLFFAMALHDTR
ncbi:MAG: MFS transporter [Candidatus Pacebacteria bacterium]|nr:MFS transporter [Candidatus Paceibacterota bacterium]MCF7857529.1 MFS transporter [Candidatus Paceibacterota bacterium]